MDVAAISNWLTNHLNTSSSVIHLFIIVVATLLLNVAEKVFYGRFKKIADKSKTFWDDVIIEAIHRPLQWFIWVMGMSFALCIVRNNSASPELFDFINPLRKTLVILLLWWFVLRIISYAEKEYIEGKGVHKGYEKTNINAIGQLLRVAVMITGVLVVLQTFNIKISGLLALSGASTLIAGLAAKDLLANFFGGLMLYLDRPFKVGDWVRSPDRNIEGTVEHIGMRLTRIRTFDKRPLYVPNSIFSTISIENPSRMRNRRIKAIVSVRYDDVKVVSKITSSVKEMLANHEEIDTSQTLIVNLVDMAPSSLDFMVYTFTKTTNWVKFQEVQEDVFLKILAIVEELGAECAFPTTTIHVPDGLNVQQ